MTNDPIDFSALDPSHDRRRWESLIRSVAEKAVQAQQDSSIAELLVRWSRPTLIAASVAAAVTCSGALQSMTQQSKQLGAYQEPPSSQLARWAESSPPQSTIQILQAFEGVQ